MKFFDTATSFVFLRHRNCVEPYFSSEKKPLSVYRIFFAGYIQCQERMNVCGITDMSNNIKSHIGIEDQFFKIDLALTQYPALLIDKRFSYSGTQSCIE